MGQAFKKIDSSDAKTYEYPRVPGTRVGETTVIALKNNGTSILINRDYNDLNKPTPLGSDIIVRYLNTQNHTFGGLLFYMRNGYTWVRKIKAKETLGDLESWNTGAAAEFQEQGQPTELPIDEIRQLNETIKGASIDPYLTEKSREFLETLWGKPPFGQIDKTPTTPTSAPKYPIFPPQNST